MTFLAVGIFSGVAALLAALYEHRKGRASLEAVLAALVAAVTTRSETISAEQFEAMVERQNRMDRQYEEWLEDVANTLEKSRNERNRVEKVISGAQARIREGKDGESAIEATAEEYGIEHGEPSEDGRMLRLSPGVGDSSEDDWRARGLAQKFGV